MSALDELTAASREEADLGRMLALVPGHDHPALAMLLERVAAAVRSGMLRPDHVEPSFAIHEPGLRLGINAAPGRRDASGSTPREVLLLSLAAAIGVDGPRIHAAVRHWLESPQHEAFVAVARASGRTRGKVYLRAAHRSRAELVGPIATLGGAPSELDARAEILCVDFDAGGAPIAFKRYVRIEPGELAARLAGSSLARLLARHGVSRDECIAYVSVRLDPAGAPVDEAVHVQVERVGARGLAHEYARMLGDPALAARLEELERAVPIVTRVLSQFVGDPRRGHVYVGLDHGAPGQSVRQ